MNKTVQFLKQHFLQFGNVSIKLGMTKSFEILDSVIMLAMDDADFMNEVDPEATDYCPAWFDLDSIDADEIFLKYLSATDGDFERIKFRNIPPFESSKNGQHIAA